MAKAIVMPKLGTTMKVGTLSKWHKGVGDYVEQGELLLSVETNKAMVDVESTSSGYFVKKIYSEGEEIPVAVTIGILASSMEEDVSSMLNDMPEENKCDTFQEDSKLFAEEPAINSNAKVLATPKARALAKKHGIELSKIKGSGKNGIITDDDVERFLSEQDTKKASPVAKKIAENNNIPIDDIEGSGLRGKIMKADVVKALEC